MDKRPAVLPLPNGRLLVVGTGALSASHLPTWIEAVRHWYPDIQIKVLVTANALKFVTPTMLAVASGHPPLGPKWPTREMIVPHREVADWAEGVLILPASGNTVAKLAAGIADSFALNVVQNAVCPVVVTPSVSPTVARSLIHTENVQRLRRCGYTVLDSVDGRSASSGTTEPGAPAPLPTVLMALAVALHAAASGKNHRPVGSIERKVSDESTGSGARS